MKTIKYISILFILFMIPYSIYSHYESKILSGIRIVLDAGHGGYDQGASIKNTYEAELNLIMVNKLEKKLSQLGCEIILTRKDDNELAKNKKEELNKRIEIINDERNDLLISIHMNKFIDEQVHGFHVFHQKNEESIQLSKIIQNTINKELNQNKEIKQGNFYILNQSRITAILIECGFISNEKERQLLMKEQYQNKIIDCIIESIKQYYQYMI